GDYKHFFGEHALNFKLGWVKDYLLFNRNHRNETNTFLLSGEYEWAPHKKLSSTFGSRYTRVIGNLSSYSTSENRMELYVLNTYRPFEKLGLSLNLRQAVYEGEFVPFSPSLSGQLYVLDEESRQISLRAAVS